MFRGRFQTGCHPAGSSGSGSWSSLSAAAIFARAASGAGEVTKGAGSRAAGLVMVFKLVESAQARWRAVNAPHLVALVRAGARFERGQLLERSQTTVA
ncbi:hypothetical protein SBADM41S_00019 [Streptomyces badius]